MSAASIADVTERASTDPVRLIVFLKMIEYYGQHAQGFLNDRETILVFPTSVSPFDSANYGDTENVVIYDAGTGDGSLLDNLNLHRRYIFKVHGQRDAAVVARRYHVSEQRTYTSFTKGHTIPELGDQTVCSATAPSTAVIDLFKSNGYTACELRRYFGDGARAYWIEDGQLIASACFVLKNSKRIWEIAGVHTHADYRRRGMAKSVVARAINDLIVSGRIPRYQVEERNRASFALAYNLGLERTGHLIHLLQDAQ